MEGKKVERINENQKQEILDILMQGKHNHSHTETDINIYEQNIFKAFLRYCEIKGILHKSFKLRNFLSGDGNGVFKPYSDIPLSQGHLLRAFRYGKQQGYIMCVSVRQRRFDQGKIQELLEAS